MTTTEEPQEDDIVIDDTSDADVEVLAPDSDEAAPTEEDEGEAVTDTAKLLRLSILVDTLYEEMRRAPLISGPAVKRIHTTLDKIVEQIPSVVDSHLTEEATLLLAGLSEDADEVETRIALAHIVGWFNGIFHNLRNADPIRAALMSMPGGMAQLAMIQQAQAASSGGQPPAGGAVEIGAGYI
jgi:hypothetical protein